MSDYFDDYVKDIPDEQRFSPKAGPPEEQQQLRGFLINHPWLEQIQAQIKDETGQKIPLGGLLTDIMGSGDYDYQRAYDIRGSDMFSIDPGTNTQHGWSRGEDGEWLKSPNHGTAWKEIFWNEAGYSPDTAWNSPHPPLTRAQASKGLLSTKE